jgi:two-component system, OmpR family, phosphate regulon sensor histidine kinase PhoR
LKNSTIHKVVIFGSIAILLVITIQSYWVLKTWNLREKEFDQTVNIALLNVAKDLSSLNKSTLPTQNLVNKIASNYYVVNINNIIDPNNLEFYLQKEFESVALSEDFEYGIYDCHSDKMIYGNYIGYETKENKAGFDPTKELPKYEDLLYYFGVRFPNKNSYLISNMGLTILFSLILFITIAFFIYSLGVILHQKRLSELQKDFINNMTHEFKTPISTIKLSADVFLNHPLIAGDKRLMQYATIIKEQNQRLNHQVEKVLQVAKIEDQNLELKLEPIHINELVVNILPSVEVKIEEKNGTISTELLAKNDLVMADNLHLTNIIHNLLDNALKYCKEVPEIIVKSRNIANSIELSISDKGMGIDKQHTAKVFDKFFRVPTGNVHNVKGFGLGLFYVKNICVAHKWKVKIDSEHEVGTTISLIIPNYDLKKNSNTIVEETNLNIA